MMTDTDNTDGPPVEQGSEGSQDFAGEAYEDAVSKDLIETPKKPRRKYGKFALGFTALSALVIGGASGGGFVRYAMPSLTPAQTPQAPAKAVDLSPLKTKVSQLTDKNAKLEAQLSKLDKAFAQLQTSVEDSVNNPETPKAPPVDLSGLTARLDALEAAPVPTPIDEGVVARLEALQKTGSPALDLSAMQARLGELEAASGKASEPLLEGLLELYEKQDELEADVDGRLTEISNNLVAVEDNLRATETRVEDLSRVDAVNLGASVAPTAAAPTSTASIPTSNAALPFPKQALLDAIGAQTQKKPFFKRALGKHIKVKTPSSPSVIIATIETDLAQGNIEAATAGFDSLPSEIRSAGRAWRDSLN